MNIIHLPDSLKKEFKLDKDGKAFVSIRGVARLCDIKSQTLDQNLGGDSKNTSRLAETLIEQGFDPASMNKTGIPDIALIHILKYYAFKAKRTTEQAERFFDAMSAIGVRTWIQNELGWSGKSDIEKLPPWHGMRRETVEVRHDLEGAIAIFIERHPEMSDNRKKFLFKNTSDQLNRQRFGKQAKQLREERGLAKNQPLRDSMTLDELFDIKRIERLVCDLILQHDIYPPDAVIEAMNRMLIPMLKPSK